MSPTLPVSLPTILVDSKYDGININRCFYDLVYLGHFLPPNLSLISIRSLIYTLKSLIFMPLFFIRLPLFSQLTWVYIQILSPFVTKESAHAMHKGGGGGWGHTGGKTYYADLHAKIFWCVIYWDKPRPNPGSHSISWLRRVLWRQDMWIMQEYNLATAVEIQTLTHPHTCERGSSILFNKSTQIFKYDKGFLPKHAIY